MIIRMGTKLFQDHHLFEVLSTVVTKKERVYWKMDSDEIFKLRSLILKIPTPDDDLGSLDNLILAQSIFVYCSPWYRLIQLCNVQVVDQKQK